MEQQTITIFKRATKASDSNKSAGEGTIRKWSRMEVILKVTERCNINCTYCYFFNLENQDYKFHPPYIKSATIEQCAKFLAQAAKESDVETLQIDFHGGEPMMMKKDRFDAMCKTFYSILKDVPDVRLVMQTNAMLIDDEWIDLFATHRLGIGISMDGPQQYHDKYRVDHQGKGTYEQTVAGLRKLQTAMKDGRLNWSDVGVICVIDPDQDAKQIFSHFVDELNLKKMHFLFPMHDHDTVPPDINEKVSKYICDLFEAWVERADPEISIRHFRRMFGLIVGGDRSRQSFNEIRSDNIAYTVSSNGDLGAADDLRNTFPQLFWTGSNVANTTLRQFLDQTVLNTHLESTRERHPDCKVCCWGIICNGGDILGTEAFRYSKKNGFNNPSIYCASIKKMLVKMTEFAIESGVSFERIAEVLNHDDGVQLPEVDTLALQ